MKLRLLAVTLASCLALAGPDAGQGAGDDLAVEKVISDQFAAFAEGDIAEAFSYASPTIRQFFGTPENFARMVEGGYPMIWSAERVRYFGLRGESGRLMERVEVRDLLGVLHYFDYEMVEVDGVWRINGVWPVKDQNV